MVYTHDFVSPAFYPRRLNTLVCFMVSDWQGEKAKNRRGSQEQVFPETARTQIPMAIFFMYQAQNYTHTRSCLVLVEGGPVTTMTRGLEPSITVNT